MSLTVSSPVTGGAQTGFTAPTYTLATDTAPTNTGKQYAVSAIGGTQTGVDTASSPSKPFYTLLTKPPSLRQLPSLNAVTGILGNVPKNVYKVRTVKGMISLTGQVPQIGSIASEISVPAGCDLNDPANVRAMLSLHIGILNQISASLGDTTVTGVI